MATGIKTYPEPWCPKCGAQMMLRRPSLHQEWPPFWGCSQFAVGCRGKRQVDEDGLPEEIDGSRGLDVDRAGDSGE